MRLANQLWKKKNYLKHPGEVESPATQELDLDPPPARAALSIGLGTQAFKIGQSLLIVLEACFSERDLKRFLGRLFTPLPSSRASFTTVIFAKSVLPGSPRASTASSRPTKERGGIRFKAG